MTKTKISITVYVCISCIFQLLQNMCRLKSLKSLPETIFRTNLIGEFEVLVFQKAYVKSIQQLLRTEFRIPPSCKIQYNITCIRFALVSRRMELIILHLSQHFIGAILCQHYHRCIYHVISILPLNLIKRRNEENIANGFCPCSQPVCACI